MATEAQRTSRITPQSRGLPLDACMFVRTAAFVKTVNEWKARNSRRSADAAARAYARENMVAVVMRGDDGAIVYLYDVAHDRIVKVAHDAPEWVA